MTEPKIKECIEWLEADPGYVREDDQQKHLATIAILRDHARLKVERDDPRVVRAARNLHSRWRAGPSEDANIFGEWDDLEDALATWDEERK